MTKGYKDMSLFHITHQGEIPGIGLNVGFANGLRVMWVWINLPCNRYTNYYLRIQRFTIITNKLVFDDYKSHILNSYCAERGMHIITREEREDLQSYWEQKTEVS